MRIDRHINTLLRVAEAIEEPVRCFRLAAGIIYKNTIVGIGVNQYKTDPFQAKYGSNDKAIYLHAEIAAIKNSLRQMDVDDFRKSTLIVVRVKRKHLTGPFIPAISKPCKGCQRCIAEFDIRNVIYTGEDGNVHYL